MRINGLLDALPLWGVFIAILFVVLISVECGYRLGKYRRSRHEQEKRVQAAVRSRIPGAIWVGLFAVAAFSLAAMGYHTGLVGMGRSLAVLAVALTFSVVIELIADLDRPQQGVLRVSQRVLLDLQQSMRADVPARPD